MKLNLDPRFSPVWRFVAAHLTGGIMAASAYVVEHPQVLTDPTAQTVAAATFALTAVSWLAGALLPKPVQP